MRLPDDIMEMKAERLEFSEMKVSKTVLGFKPTGRVCNISRCPFPDFSVLYGCVVNGLRMASEATTPYLALKYRKIGKRGFPRIFRPENRKHRTSLPQSTEVLMGKYGCLCQNSPMFFGPKQVVLHVFLLFYEIFAAKSDESGRILHVSNRSN